jgi:hypothetical protein
MKKTLVLPLVGIAAMALTGCGESSGVAKVYSNSTEISSQTALIATVGTSIKANLAEGQGIYEFDYGVDFSYPDASYIWVNGNGVVDANGLITKYTDNACEVVDVRLYTESTLGAKVGNVYYGYVASPVTYPVEVNKKGETVVDYRDVVGTWSKGSLSDLLVNCSNTNGSVDALKKAVSGDCYVLPVNFATYNISNPSVLTIGDIAITLFVVGAATTDKDSSDAKPSIEDAKSLVSSITGDCLTEF